MITGTKHIRMKNGQLFDLGLAAALALIVLALMGLGLGFKF